MVFIGPPCRSVEQDERIIAKDMQEREWGHVAVIFRHFFTKSLIHVPYFAFRITLVTQLLLTHATLMMLLANTENSLHASY